MPNASSSKKKESARDRTLISGTAMLLGVGTRSAASLLVVRFALRHLGAEEFGLWVVLQSLVAYLSLSEIGLGQTVMNYQGDAFARGDRTRVNQVLNTAFGLYLILIGVVWVLGCASALGLPLHSWFIKSASPALISHFPKYLVLFSTLALLTIPTTVMSATLSGLRDHHVRQTFELFLPIVTLIAVWSLFSLNGGILGLIIVTSTLQLLWGVSSYFLLRIKHPFVKLSPQSWNWDLAPQLFRNSVFFFLISLALLIHRSTGNLLTSRFGELSQIPQMNAVLMILRVLGWALIDIGSRALQPYIILYESTGQKDKILFFSALSTKLSHAGALAFAATVWLLGEFIISLWLGPGIFLGYSRLWPLLGSFFIDVCFLPAFNILVAKNRHKELSLLLAFHAFVSLLLGLLGARYFQKDALFGIGLGFFFASALIQGCGMPWIASRGLGLSLQDFLKRFLKGPFLLTLLVSLPLALIPWAHVSTLGPRVAELLVTVTIIFVGTWMAVLNPEERAFLLSFRRRSLP